MIIFWAVIIIAAISIALSFVSFKKERQKHEIEEAKKDISRGRVIYHS